MITLEKFFEALNQVEARGRKRNVPAGDGGTRIGPLQISEIYWKDAREWMNKQNTHFIPLGFFEALFLLFLGLKLCGVIEWSWWWVFAPMWVPPLLIITIMLACLVFDPSEKKS